LPFPVAKGPPFIGEGRPYTGATGREPKGRKHKTRERERERGCVLRVYGLSFGLLSLELFDWLAIFGTFGSAGIVHGVLYSVENSAQYGVQHGRLDGMASSMVDRAIRFTVDHCGVAECGMRSGWGHCSPVADHVPPSPG
jgi:hypothetical protein